MRLFQYLARLFDDWVGRVSTCLTALFLLSGLFSQYLPSQLLEMVPRDVLIFLSFISFVVANYHIYHQANPAAQLDLRITDWEDPHIKGGGISIEGRAIWLEDSLPISLACRVRISNPGPPTSARLVVRDIKPECTSEAVPPTDIEVETFHLPKFPHQGTFEKSDNPCYLRQDEATTVLLKFLVPIELILVEQKCGALAKLTEIAGKLVAIQPNEESVHSTFTVDLRIVHEAIESNVASKIGSLGIGNKRNCLPEAKEFLGTLKRYWNGQTN